MHVDGLNVSIKTLVTRYPEKKCKENFLDVVQFDRAEGDAIRERDEKQ